MAVERRLRAARLCHNASLGSGLAIIMAAVAMQVPPEMDLDFVLFSPAALIGGASAALGLLGLRRLERAGPGRPLDECEHGRERFASRRMRHARRWASFAAVGGILVALVSSPFATLSFLRVTKIHHVASLPRSSAAQQRLFNEVELNTSVDRNGNRLRMDAYGLGRHRKLPASELAWRLRKFMEDYPDIYATWRIREAPGEPWSNYRLLLSRHSADLEELTLEAVRDLAVVLRTGERWDAMVAALALGDMPDPPPSVVVALRWAVDHAQWDVRRNARKALEKLGQ